MSVSSRHLCVALFLGLGALVLPSCGTTSSANAPQWPTASIFPESPPKDLQTGAPASLLRRGSDGFLYLVGGLKEGTKEGSTFLARYSGQWPFKDIPRSPLATGQILKVYSKDVALVQMLYVLPETAIEELEITWESANPVEEGMGKGLAPVTAVAGDADYPQSVTLPLGKNLGVQPGDTYALMGKDAGKPLSERLASVCMVQRVDDGQSVCVLWRGSMVHGYPPAPKAGDLALFLEHKYTMPPMPGRILFGKIQGDKDDALRTRLIAAMQGYLNTHANAQVKLVPVDASMDPGSHIFYQVDRKLPPSQGPEVFVGAAIKTIDGDPSLVVNYTGVGMGSGPGMIAAPPETGMNFGPVDDLDDEKEVLQGLFGTLLGGMLVQRGQTSEALMHLRQMLGAGGLPETARWHVRDQFAMRWAALDRLDEATMLVLKDLQVAKERDDELAQLNALGSVVRFHSMLDVPALALEGATRYLTIRKARATSKEDQAQMPVPLLSAYSMYGEMLAANGQYAEAMAQNEEILKVCAGRCDSEVFPFLAGLFWVLPADQAELQAKLVTQLREHVNKEDKMQEASLMIYLGAQSMRQNEFAQSQLAFSEARRRFEELKSLPGISRALYFSFWSYLGMKEPLQADEAATEALKIAEILRDYDAASRIYDRLAGVYAGLELEEAPLPYLRISIRVLTAVYESQLAQGNMAATSHTLLTISTLFMKTGSLGNARSAAQKALIYALRTVRFDVAAMAHVTLAVVARQQGDAQGFEQEIGKARVMAEISKDENLNALIDNLINRPDSPDVDRDEDADTRVF